MASRTFKYVDKDRILPWLQREYEKWVDTAYETDDPVAKAGYRGRAMMCRDILAKIQEGLWDWQPA